MVKEIPYPGFLILGLFLFLGSCYMISSNGKMDLDLSTITITVKQVHINSHRSNYRYSIYANKYRSVFGLKKGASDKIVHKFFSVVEPN